MSNYNHKEIEKKWQLRWEENGINKTSDEAGKEKYYCLDMFPYPSGAGLHAGHVESYTATDIMSRYQRMNGKNVLHPQGFDAFGLPAENFAIKTGTHPAVTTEDNIKNFTRQMKSLGLSYDWSRVINTSTPEYYKWTQWFFSLLYKNGLAYKKKSKVNWCAKCQTVLANEQANGGVCDRCGTKVEQKDLEQWFFKITDFIETQKTHPGLSATPLDRGEYTSGLIDGLDKVDWPESIKAAQRNWIGRSEGTLVKFQIPNNKSQINAEYLEVFTTRVDTIFGCTYCVVAPEHPLVANLKSQIENWDEVEKYVLDTKNKTDLDRMEAKEKTGVELKGVKVVNPFNGVEVPLFAADYVLGSYGTGAVMAVPAHDERDFEFAEKYGLPIEQSVTTDYEAYKTTIKSLNALKEINKAADKKGLKIWLLGGLAIPFYARVIYREHSDLDLIAQTDEELEKAKQLFEELGFEKVGEKRISESVVNFLYKKDDIEIDIGPNQGEFGLADDFDNDVKNVAGVESRVLSFRFIKSFKEYQTKSRSKEKDKLDLEYLNGKVLTDDGVLVNSGVFTGLTSADAREKMTAWLEEKGFGSRKVNYRLRDWLVSRQRYWGAPIPVIYCDACGEQLDENLPVELPTDVDFKPTGESPLVYSKTFHNVKCSKCGAAARRESDTMDTFVCSSWYYFRYTDHENKNEFASKENIQKWLPVDLYVGGAEHAVLHLLYARFFTKVLHHLGYIDFDEPFLKLRNQGMILAEDGRKMSKSLGNVVNPDEVVESHGADSLRMFEMFMGPLEDAKPWNTKGIIGIRRFLEKIYNIVETKQMGICDCMAGKCTSAPKSLVTLVHKTVKKVGEDIEEFKFNTAIAQMMILVNEMMKYEALPQASVEKLLQVLAPFAPHLTEELWEKLGHTESIFKAGWPEYNADKIVDETINLVIQVNGKNRDIIEVSADIAEAEAKELAVNSENVKKWLDKEIKKVIYIKGRLVNIVV